jgi:glutamyl-tRNA synthetase
LLAILAADEQNAAAARRVPDAVFRQSGRFALYRAAAKKLRDAGRLYPCYKTAVELDRKRKRQQARGLPPVYDRAALALSGPERARLGAEGRRPHWRFKLDHEILRWKDLVRGDSHIDCASLSDPVLLREDGTYLYTLPSVVDDIEQKITYIIRGEDHVTNTAVQSRAGQAPFLRASQPFVFGDRRSAVETLRRVVDRRVA